MKNRIFEFVLRNFFSKWNMTLISTIQNINNRIIHHLKKNFNTIFLKFFSILNQSIQFWFTFLIRSFNHDLSKFLIQNIILKFYSNILFIEDRFEITLNNYLKKKKKSSSLQSKNISIQFFVWRFVFFITKKYRQITISMKETFCFDWIW